MAKPPPAMPGKSVNVSMIRLCLKQTKLTRQCCSRSSYLGRRSSIDLDKDRVEPSKAAESGAHGDLSHWERGFVEQPFRSLHAGRLGNLNRACAQVPSKEAIEVSCSDPETLRQRFDAVLVECAACYQTKRPLNGCA